MDDEQFLAAMTSESPDMEAIEAIAAERKRRSEEENRIALERAEKKRLDDEAIAKAREEQVKEALEELRREKNGKAKADNLCDDIFANFREFTDKNNNGVPDDWEVSVDDVDPDPLKKDENTDKNDSDK